MLIYPDWPAPANVHAVSSSRLGGNSSGVYASLNLGLHVQDDATLVRQNRLHYQQLANMPGSGIAGAAAANVAINSVAINCPIRPLWLQQVHGIEVAELTLNSTEPIIADACFTTLKQQVCTVMTADCLPLLICDKAGRQVAAIHAGWRGLCAGIIEQTVARFHQPQQLLVWLGPAISQAAFAVGPEVRAAFIQHDPKAEQAFSLQDNNQHKTTKYHADLYQLAKQRLQAVGINAIYGGEYCTYQQSELFFSYRRDGETGRMASSIWLD